LPSHIAKILGSTLRSFLPRQGGLTKAKRQKQFSKNIKKKLKVEKKVTKKITKYKSYQKKYKIKNVFPKKFIKAS
jgi:hypothetical protein